MEFGVYIHIPYCIQRCKYCTFTTVGWQKSLPPDQYIDLIINEIEARHKAAPTHKIHSVFFGGGTPSLLSGPQINRILNSLKNVGFQFSSDIEITIEVNPETINKMKLNDFLNIGINRFSLGVQSFFNSRLKTMGREHNVDHSFAAIELLKKNNLSYSLDLIFALPHQNIKNLMAEMEFIKNICPPHISAYFLTVPQGHEMAKHRANDEDQANMFQLVETELLSIGLKRYEISNFSLPNYQCRHNNIYWSDDPYWGLGVSAHSYFPHPDMGMRFWNPKDMKSYEQQILKSSQNSKNIFEKWPSRQMEKLKVHESATDFCYTQLRRSIGLNEAALRHKFPLASTQIITRMKSSKIKNLISLENNNWRLTPVGLLLSDQVFSHLTFLENDGLTPTIEQ